MSPSASLDVVGNRSLTCREWNPIIQMVALSPYKGYNISNEKPEITEKPTLKRS